MHLGGEWIRKAELQVDARAQRLVEQVLQPLAAELRKHDQIHPPHRVVHDPVDTAAGRDDRAIAGDLVAAHHHEAVLVAVVPPAAVAAQELALLGAYARVRNASRRAGSTPAAVTIVHAVIWTGRALTPARRAVNAGPATRHRPRVVGTPSRWRSAANGRARSHARVPRGRRRTTWSSAPTRAETPSSSEDLALYVPPGATVADVTYGKGAFWKDVAAQPYQVLASDVSIGIDCRALPYHVSTGIDCRALRMRTRP